MGNTGGVGQSCDVFLSYAHKDLDVHERARDMYRLLMDRGWSVFWDTTIRVGGDWRARLDERLATCRSVLVLWDHHSVQSAEVRREADAALAADKFLHARLSAVTVPQPFAAIEWAKLETWDGGRTHRELAKLLSEIEGLALPRTEAVTLPDPGGCDISAHHVQLVHSSQRRSDADTGDGRRMYRIQVMLVGHPGALARVKAVNYLLDGAYKGRTARRQDDRTGNFGFSELANGYSVVDASVEIEDQDTRVHLSRFINLMENGPDLVKQFAPQFGPRRKNGLTMMAPDARPNSR